MTLPKNGTAWPPRSEHSEKLAEWSAWYSGDPCELQTFYGPRNGNVDVKPNQLRGGVVGKIARWWWGVPTANGEQAAKLHVPLAADICGTSADLLFSEPISLTAEDASDKSTSDFLSGLQEDGLDAVLHEAAEVASAMSGVYLRTVWDKSVSPRPWTEAAHPDGAIPTFRGGRLAAVTFWSELHRDNTTVYRLLERHEVGTVEYGLYVGTESNLGKAVPLTEHPDPTEGARLASLVNEQGVQPTGLTRLAAVYIPNMRPNRLHRHSPEGRSDLQGVEPWLDALDEAYSSWWRDIRHAKSRIHVPASMLEQMDGPGTPGIADVDREVYVPMQGVLAGRDQSMSDMLQVQQFTIRVNEHKDTCEFWTAKIIESAGYSTQTLDGDGDKTATEVRAHQNRSYMTRGKKVRYWTKGLREHLAVQLEVGALLGAGVAKDAAFKVEFPDGVQESAMQLAQTALALRNAEAASTKTRVQMLHPDWDSQAVDDEVALILSESSAVEPVPVPGDAGL